MRRGEAKSRVASMILRMRDLKWAIEFYRIKRIRVGEQIVDCPLALARFSDLKKYTQDLILRKREDVTFRLIFCSEARARKSGLGFLKRKGMELMGSLFKIMTGCDLIML